MWGKIITNYKNGETVTVATVYLKLLHTYRLTGALGSRELNQPNLCSQTGPSAPPLPQEFLSSLLSLPRTKQQLALHEA